MHVTATKKLSYTTLIVYCIALYTFWAFRTLYIKPIFDDTLPLLTAELIGTFIKLISWVIPAMLFIHIYKKDLTFSLKQLFFSKINWKLFVVVAGCFLAYNLIGAFIQFQAINVHPNFNSVSLIGTVLFVGITEEIVFRGWLLNAFLKKMNQNKAIIINGLLFILIHFPIWIYKGQFTEPLIIASRCVSVFILSGIFSYVLIKGKSIVPSILLHMFWNLLVCIITGG